MKILCLDDEPLALRMLEQAVKTAKPDAGPYSCKNCSQFLLRSDLDSLSTAHGMNKGSWHGLSERLSLRKARRVP